MKKTTKKTTYTIETIFEGFRNTIKTVKKTWKEQNDVHGKMFYMVSDYDGKIDLKRLLYWTVCGQVDTAIRPVMASMIDFIATANGYAMDCDENMAYFHKMFMTNIKKTQIKNACKVFAQGWALDGDCEEFEKILTKFYCDMSINDRIHAFEDTISDFGLLVK